MSCRILEVDVGMALSIMRTMPNMKNSKEADRSVNKCLKYQAVHQQGHSSHWSFLSLALIWCSYFCLSYIGLIGSFVATMRWKLVKPSDKYVWPNLY